MKYQLILISKMQPNNLTDAFLVYESNNYYRTTKKYLELKKVLTEYQELHLVERNESKIIKD